MTLTTRSLSSGEIAFFDDTDRTLYLVPTGSSIATDAANLDDLRRAVEKGGAQSFDRATLESISQALSKMVLLQADPPAQ